MYTYLIFSIYYDYITLINGITFDKVGRCSDDSCIVKLSKGFKSITKSLMVCHCSFDGMSGHRGKPIETSISGSLTISKRSIMISVLFQRIAMSCLSFKTGEFSCFCFS